MTEGKQVEIRRSLSCPRNWVVLLTVDGRYIHPDGNACSFSKYIDYPTKVQAEEVRDLYLGKQDRKVDNLAEEQVLVIKRKVIEQIGMFQGLAFNVADYLSKIFVEGVPRFIPRIQAEQDSSYKQIIPYIIMTHGGKYFSYVRGRRAGETRLVGNRSIGVGGHINPNDDVSSSNADFCWTYLAAVQREVNEEVSVGTTHTDRIIALLNDESNEVGSMHLGIIHLWNLDAAKVSKREQMITQTAFMSIAELEKVQDTLETWSILCLREIL